ncbi:MAG TPA: DUF1015 domain-containing protein [Acidimicrobiales bacterium]|nr:DUF1015 domain-containing protein [Acidimicrobiales bacterium]
MPRFEPFRGLRYAPSIDLDSVAAPPYDVIGPEERAALAARSAYNSVLVELPADEPDRDRFAQAAHLMAAWKDEGILQAEPVPAFYICRMTFDDEAGRRRSTTGVIGALELATPGEGDVLPHERTMPKPKSERLDLQRATRANLSPVWGLSMADGLSQLIEPAPDSARGSCRDDEGVVHELWLLTDPAAVDAVRRAVASAPVVLADGHHRYETGLAYREERRAETGGAPGDYDLIMAYVVELTDTQLSVRAIHRLISGLPDGLDLPSAFGAHFEVSEAGPVDPSFLVKMEKAGSLGLVTPTGSWLMRPRPETEAGAEHDLDSARLDVALASLPHPEVTYQHGVEHVTAAVDKGEAQAAVLLRPATVETIASVARRRLRMPPKTTFFYPKPRTGLVFRPVTD